MNTTHRFATLASVCFIMLLAGCSTPTFVTYDGSFSVENETFRMNGEVVVNGPGGDEQYKDVTVYLYSNNTTIIKERDLGTLDQQAQINMTSERVPRYVIIHSDDFYNEENMIVNYFKRTRHRNQTLYSEQSVGNRSQYPVTLPDETG